MRTHVERLQRQHTGNTVLCSGENSAGGNRLFAGFRIDRGLLQTVAGGIFRIECIRCAAADLFPETMGNIKVIIGTVQIANQGTEGSMCSFVIQAKCICCAGECPDSLTECRSIVIIGTCDCTKSIMSTFAVGRNDGVDHIEGTAVIVI